MDFADTSFMDVVADGKAAILVTELVRIVRQSDVDSETVGGVVALRVLRELTPRRWTGPNEIEVGFAQYREPRLRIRQGKLGWNGVQIEQGKLLLVAFPPGAAERPEARPGEPLAALAVRPLASADDDLVRGVEGALRIEATSDVDQRAALIQQGLAGTPEFLADYSHYAAGRLQRIPRERAVAMELAVLDDTTRAAQDRNAAQATLELELWESESPADPLNRRILEGFFRALPTGDKDLRRALLLAIYNSLDGDASGADAAAAADRRKLLMTGVRLPAGTALDPVLQELERDQDTATEAAWVRRFIGGS